ncbi:unnamed protein product [Trichobilharzia regenti]|nr:unnamed protein product [Trichobilharzia regenti]
MTLKRFILNVIEIKCFNLDRNIWQRQTAADNLPDKLRSMFVNYVEVTGKCIDKHNACLMKTLEKQPPQIIFAIHLKKYANKFSRVSLTPLELEVFLLHPRYRDVINRPIRLDTELQLETLFNQTNDLVP